MQRQKLEKFKCELITREYKLIGQSITAHFPTGFPEAAKRVQMEFAERRGEIKNAVDREVIFSPHMCNGIVATYFACLEVNALTDIPEGMIGFTIPSVTYAKIHCTTKSIDEAYGEVFRWMHENGYEQKYLDNTCPIEVFYYEDNVEEKDVELLIPLRS